MKTFKALLKGLPVLLAGITLFSSCVRETEIGNPNPNGTGEVRFVIDTPAPTIVKTRSVGNEDENAIDKLYLFVFDEDGKLVKYFEKDDTGLTATPDNVGNNHSFTGSLPISGTVEYSFLAVANTTMNLSSVVLGTTNRAAVEALVSDVTVSAKWDVTTTPIPMWGKLDDQTLSTSTATVTVPVRRMMARVNVNVATTAQTDFFLKEVHFYNYNTKGAVIPASASFSGNDYVAPTIPNPSGKKAASDAAAFSYTVTDNVKCENSIYVFENANENSYDGTAGTGDWKDNPCVVVGGSYGSADGAVTYYRLDFIDGSGDWLSVLRNHSYNFNITKVKGHGYATAPEALVSAPINMAASVFDWDDSDMKDGEWNGSYSIQLSGRHVDFTQFGVAKASTTNTISILTDVPDLAFSGFVNNAFYTARDNEWREKSSGVWTNDHFTATITSASEGEKTRFTIVFTARATIDVESTHNRKATFTAAGGGLSVTFTINQDKHVEYRLDTDPASATPIVRDGTNARFPIKVTSTHKFDITMTTGPSEIFAGVYDSPTGGNLLTTGIAANIGTIYVEVNAYGLPTPRVGSFSLAHNAQDVIDQGGSVSTAGSRNFNVIQVTPVITAELTEGGYQTTIAKGGGSKDIKIESNMSAWKAVLTINETAVADADLGDYLDVYSGSNNATVKLTAPALPGTTDRVFKIYFGDGTTTSAANTITIIQKAEVLGQGGGGNGASTGVAAVENILSVDKNGVLNLDGPARLDNYIVYFKWNSVIAIAGGANDEVFDKTDVAWTPVGYDYDALMTSIGDKTANDAWALIPASTVKDWNDGNVAAGFGDPCKFAVKGSTVGGYKTPDGNPYNNYGYGNESLPTAVVDGVAGRVATRPDTQFYPYVGRRGYSSGDVGGVGTSGYYWSRAPYANTTHSYGLGFTASQVYSSTEYNHTFGLAVRCVSE